MLTAIVTLFICMRTNPKSSDHVLFATNLKLHEKFKKFFFFLVYYVIVKCDFLLKFMILNRVPNMVHVATYSHLKRSDLNIIFN